MQPVSGQPSQAQSQPREENNPQTAEKEKELARMKRDALEGVGSEWKIIKQEWHNLVREISNLFNGKASRKEAEVAIIKLSLISLVITFFCYIVYEL
ncbi:hypothetical protein ABK040_014226 [Willaertia magna]